MSEIMANARAQGSLARPRSEPLSAFDAQLAQLFRDMRQLTKLDLATLAYRLATSVDVLHALEQGHIAYLRPGVELERVVREYAKWVGIDPRPIYERIVLFAGSSATAEPAWPFPRDADPGPTRAEFAHHTSPAIPTTGRQPALSPPIAPAISSSYSSGQAPTAAIGRHQPRQAEAVLPDEPALDARGSDRRRRRRNRQRLLTVGLPAVIGLSLLWGTTRQPQRLLQLAASLPPPLSWAAYRLGESMLVRNAEVKDGLRWIEVDDPRIRKADKLPSKAR